MTVETCKGEVLVVDDQPANLEILAYILEQHQFKTRAALSGKLALAAVQAALPDLILLDIVMPGMSGFEVCEALKADEKTRAIPIICISALDDTVNKVKALTAGCVDYITKPFQSAEVIARVENHLQLYYLQKDLDWRNIELHRLVEENARLYQETQGWADVLEKQVQERTQQLEQALHREQALRDQLVQTGKLAALGRMVASVAHELNNPLQTIQNVFFLLQKKISGETQAEKYLQLGLGEVKRLSDLVANLRQVYRSDLPGGIGPVNLVELVAEVKQLIEPHLIQNKVSWEAPAMCDCPAVAGNKDHLKQVFLNLSLNAIDAMKPDGGCLSICCQRTPDLQQVQIDFTDCGQGIPPENLESVFEPFFTTKTNGMGLGLAISYDIIQKHGGTIVAHSQVGQGSTFTICLPQWDEREGKKDVR